MKPDGFEHAGPDARARHIEGLDQDSDADTIRRVIGALADESMLVRGEAFAWLLSLNADVAGLLAKGLRHEDRHVRGYCALVLANRGDAGSSNEIASLANDESAMVRSCVAGALGFLKSSEYGGVVLALTDDESPEVAESARDAAARMKL